MKDPTAGVHGDGEAPAATKTHGGVRPARRWLAGVVHAGPKDRPAGLDLVGKREEAEAELTEGSKRAEARR